MEDSLFVKELPLLCDTITLIYFKRRPFMYCLCCKVYVCKYGSNLLEMNIKGIKVLGEVI